MEIRTNLLTPITVALGHSDTQLLNISNLRALETIKVRLNG
jgi:hypothetical protein